MARRGPAPHRHSASRRGNWRVGHSTRTTGKRTTMTLKERLKDDVIAHMKAGNKTALTTVRNVLGEIGTREKSGKTPVELDDAQVTSLLHKDVDKRRTT